MDAGIACFAAHGFKGATTRTLAGAAGVNIATLAYHFGDKQGLYRAAIDRLYERLLDLQPDPSLLVSGTPRERVANVARFAVRFARDHQTEVRLLLRHVLEEGQLPAPLRERWLGELLEQAQVVRQFLGLAEDPRFRLKLLAINHLVVRFAITPPEELAPFVDDPATGEAEVEALLVELAQDLLAGPG